ncbi:MAG: S-layer homology domain-containing protein, partial [Lysinibacillus sp.]
MEKKKVQKLNKAVVATVLAASGVTVTAPMLPTKASTHFKDLNPNADYYQPVIELASRGYISGYQDGTFRPNQAITRGQAAKMLAMALNLNVTNPSNPGFRDVPTNHDFYNYIAALANEGIINGYADKTFRPNEPINRNQMAKILTLGYKFQVSTKQTHGFADVSESNANRYFIQTLYDLGITKGTTGNTYSPFGSVTRGQLATFIVRAENTSAEKVKPIKEIGEVIGADVYINGIKYRVDASLRDIINDTNAAALKGAHIEGQIVGETLKTISSLTINAQGTANRMLTFDGNNSTFSGELKVQGNYILFKNWHLTGLVTIAEAPRRTLSDLANMRIASLTGLGFIDWNKPTDTTENDDDPTYNGGGNDLTDKPSIDTGGKVVDRMPVIDKYVDFSNCSIQRLVIEANRTYVAAANKLPNVTVQGWVRQFEIYANIGTLYIEPDVKTTMFGVGDIDTIYKNSFKDVFLNTDSHVKLMVVDNSSGWIDLGDHFYVDKVIIPPNKMPNDIFNDFIKDNDKIGDIEDPSGNDIDRDPIENTIIPDMEAPTAQIVKINVQGSSMTAGIKSSEDGYYYYTIRKADDRIPTIREIIEEAETTTLKTSGTGWLDQDLEKTITASGLEENAEYVLYLITKDEADNYSDKVSKEFTTMDGTPPRIDNLQATALTGGTRAKITFRPSETGKYQYKIVQAATADTNPPTLEDLLSQPENDIKPENLSGIEFIHKDLKPGESYYVYMVMTDMSGNQSEIVKSNLFTMGPEDFERPYVLKTQLDNTDIKDLYKEPTEVTLTFSEPLDPEKAINVKNYTLSGTGNLTGNPYSATLSRDGTKVTLKIPSMAAFVNNDTLVIKVTGVEDLAGLEILDNSETNIATYKFKSDSNPSLTNLTVTPKAPEGPLDVREVTFKSDYAGTYYYIILPAVDENHNAVPAPGVSEVVFPTEHYGTGDVFKNDFAIAAGKGEALVGDGATEGFLGNKFQVKYDDQNLSEYGYYIYMVVRDRNGNYTSVVREAFIPDEDAPKIDYATFIDPESTDDYKLPANQKQSFYYPTSYTTGTKQTFKFYLEFSEPMLKSSIDNPSDYQLAGDLKDLMTITNVAVSSDNRSVVLDISGPADEYSLIQDRTLDIIVKNPKDTFGKGEYQSISPGFFFKYEDRVKPKLKSNIAFRVDGNTTPEAIKDSAREIWVLDGGTIEVELTFTEAMDVATLENTGNYIISNTLGSTATLTKAEVIDGDNTKVRLTLAGGKDSFIDEDKFIISLKSDSVKDIVGNAVPTVDAKDYQANYVYRAIPLTIRGLQLEGAITEVTGTGTLGNVYQSQAMLVTLLSDYSYQGIKMYYAVSNRNLTPDQIINAQNYSYSDVYGSKSMENISQSMIFTVDLPQVFQADQMINFISVDEYGNVSKISREKLQLPPGYVPPS